MATITRIGPADHGQAMTLDEFYGGDYEGGYQYELIDGRLYVSPLPNLPENRVEEWIGAKLLFYSRRYPEVTNYVCAKARVFIPGRTGVTNPEPDRAAYKNFPLHLPLEEVNWRHVSPFLVVEVLSEDDPHKDLIRNVALYWLVPTIKEYWIFDARKSASRPTMIVYRRHGSKWQRLEVAPGETYTTKLLPGFKLVVDPRK